MENILFPSKSSFAVFVCLILSVATVSSFISPDKLFTSANATVDHTMTRLLNDQRLMLPEVAGIVDRATHMLEPVSLIRTAAADDGADAAVEWLANPDVGTKPARPEPVAVPKNDLQCMAENIYYEAGSQSYAGKIAVGQVVLNRVKTPSYPRTVCGVIYEGSQNTQTSSCQFSWTCSTRAAIAKNSSNWMQSLRAATELLSHKNAMIDIVEGATSFHAASVKPSWAKKLKFVAKIDDHLFYSTK